MGNKIATFQADGFTDDIVVTNSAIIQQLEYPEQAFP
jgi:hypothetical protein